MTKRVVAAVGVGVAALLVLAGGAGAQTYPPAPNAITVDDPTPAPGQVINVRLTTCRPGTIALIGIDLRLVATPVVDADGAAQAQVAVPTTIRPGRHVVSGACLGPSWEPLFLTTRITVEATPSAGTGADAGGTAGSGGGGGTAAGGTAVAAPALDSLAGPSVPPDAALLYQTTALAHGVGEGGASDAGTSGGRPARAEASGTSDGGPGTLGALARVSLGLLAVGGVPVAMAISRRPSRAVRSGFA